MLQFFNCHHQFLLLDHLCRKLEDKFRTIVEHAPLIHRLSSKEIWVRLKSRPNLAFRTNISNERMSRYTDTHHCVKKRVFFLRASILVYQSYFSQFDGMLIQWNIFENVLTQWWMSRTKLKTRLGMKVLVVKYHNALIVLLSVVIICQVINWAGWYGEWQKFPTLIDLNWSLSSCIFEEPF